MVTFPSLLLVMAPGAILTRLRRRYNTCILGHFSRFAGLLIRILYGTNVYIYCDDDKILDEDQSKVLISSNHRTRIDWMFIIWIYGSVIRKVSGNYILSSYQVVDLIAVRPVVYLI